MSPYVGMDDNPVALCDPYGLATGDPPTVTDHGDGWVTVDDGKGTSRFPKCWLPSELSGGGTPKDPTPETKEPEAVQQKKEDGLVSAPSETEVENSPSPKEKTQTTPQTYKPNPVENTSQRSSLVTDVSSENRTSSQLFTIRSPQRLSYNPKPSVKLNPAGISLNISKFTIAPKVQVTITTVSEPGLAESFIPIWGSGKSAIYNFQQGNYWTAGFHTVMAVSDCFMVGAAGKFLFKGGIASVSLGMAFFKTGSKNIGGRGLWKLTEQGASTLKVHKAFGKLYKSKSDGLWWAVDNAQHGGSKFKVFKETKGGLEWFRDADEFGDFILNKHKGAVGKFIPWDQLSTIW